MFLAGLTTLICTVLPAHTGMDTMRATQDVDVQEIQTGVFYVPWEHPEGLMYQHAGQKVLWRKKDRRGSNFGDVDVMFCEWSK